MNHCFQINFLPSTIITRIIKEICGDDSRHHYVGDCVNAQPFNPQSFLKHSGSLLFPSLSEVLTSLIPTANSGQSVVKVKQHFQQI